MGAFGKGQGQIHRMPLMKLFFIAGTQLPFPRMDEAIVKLLENNDQAFNITYQSGQREDFSTKNLMQYKLMNEVLFMETLLDADLIIAHAGVGTLLECIENKKPVLMFPRLAKLGEHRNDHQLSTAKKIQEIFQIPYLLTVKDLINYIQNRDLRPEIGFYFRQMMHNRTELQKNLHNSIKELLSR